MGNAQSGGFVVFPTLIVLVVTTASTFFFLMLFSGRQTSFCIISPSGGEGALNSNTYLHEIF